MDWFTTVMLAAGLIWVLYSSARVWELSAKVRQQDREIYDLKQQVRALNRVTGLTNITTGKGR